MPAGIEARTEQIFDSLAAVLKEAGTGLNVVVKATVFVTDLGDFAKLNARLREALRRPQTGALDRAGGGAAARRQRRDRVHRPPAAGGLTDAGRRTRRPNRQLQITGDPPRRPCYAQPRHPVFWDRRGNMQGQVA